jgi:type I restriction enzyme S subunit
MTHRLPPAWLETTFDELLRTIGGGTPATGRSEFWGDGVPWITSADIDDAGNITPRKAVTPSGITSSATNPVPPGSVIVVTRVGLGKVGLAKQKLCFSQDCQALLFNPELFDPSFVAHQARRIVRGIRGRGTTIAGVTVKQLGALPFSLAPLPEQHRIVEAIDSYLTRLDDAVASLKRVQAKLKAYRASVLKVAVEGRLVPTEASLARAEKRAYEPAEALLARILKERRRRWEEAELAKLKAAAKTPKDDKWKAKYEEPVAPDTSTLPELPEGWCWASLAQLTTHITSGSRGWAEYYSKGGATFVRAQDIKTDALAFDKIAHVSPPRGAEGARTSVSQFDLLITITGANVTKAALVEDSLGEAYVSQHVGLCRPVLTQLAPYLHLFIVCPSGGRRVLEKAAYGAGKPGLNLDNLKELAVALPAAAEAARVVEQCAVLLSVAENLAETATHDLNSVRKLRQAVLKWAFDGRLLDQDPTDEPADELLARIRAERATSAPIKKSRARAAKGAA